MFKIIIISLFSISLFSQTIVWNTVEFPPSLITKGDLKDKGYSDKARLLMSKTINDYTYEVQYVNTPRVISNLRNKENHCFSGLNKNKKREKFIYFSEPFMMSLPNEIIIKKQNLNKFKHYIDKKGLINFEALLQNKDLKLAYTKERSYSKFIDKIITKYEKNQNLKYRPASDLTQGFLKMLEAERADYIIDYPVMVGFNSSYEFLSIPIKNSNTTFPVYIGCSKTKIAKDFIMKINDVIKENKKLLSSFYTQYLDEYTRKRYLQNVQK